MPGINLRSELTAMLKESGWWAVLRHRVGMKKLEPFNTTTQEGIPKKTRSLGSGEGWTDQFVRVRNMSLSESDEKQVSIGTFAEARTRFYLQHHVKPDPHDFIIEVAQEDGSETRNGQIQPSRPYKIARIWDIQEVRAMRDQGGRCEFWQVLAVEVVTGDY